MFLEHREHAIQTAIFSKYVAILICLICSQTLVTLIIY